MSHRTRTTAMTIAAVAGLAAGLAVPAATASPITDFINGIGTGSAAPGAGAPATTEIRFASGSSRDGRGYVVSRGSSPEDSCVTITDSWSGRPVTNGYGVSPLTNNIWTVGVDTARPGCTAPLQTTVGFSNSDHGSPALLIQVGRAIYVSCADGSASDRTGCERSYSPPDVFDFEIR